MPIFNHFGITDLYFSKEKTQRTIFLHLQLRGFFMDTLNVVPQTNKLICIKQYR